MNPFLSRLMGGEANQGSMLNPRLRKTLTPEAPPDYSLPSADFPTTPDTTIPSVPSLGSSNEIAGASNPSATPSISPAGSALRRLMGGFSGGYGRNPQSQQPSGMGTLGGILGGFARGWERPRSYNPQYNSQRPL